MYQLLILGNRVSVFMIRIVEVLELSKYFGLLTLFSSFVPVTN